MAKDAIELRLRELSDTLKRVEKLLDIAQKQNEDLTKQLQSKDDQIKERDERLVAMQEQLDFLTKKLFGHSSEKKDHQIEGQISLFDEAETSQDPKQLAEDAAGDTTEVKGHTRKKKASYQELFKGVPVEEVIIPLPEDKQVCPECGTRMKVIGKELVRRELKFIPAEVSVIEYYSETYGCPACKLGDGPTEKPVMVKSEVPSGLIGKSYASESTVAWAIYQKYANALPLYRQEKDWKQYGVSITRTTLANWIIYCAENYFVHLYDYWHRELLKRQFAMADETRVQVLDEPDRRPETQSFMWVFLSGEDGLNPIRLFGYTQTRNGDHAAEFLNGYQGYLETDGYQGYNKVRGVKRCSCWAHLRRYFIDAVPKGKQFDLAQPSVQGVHYCDRLFELEKQINKKCGKDYEKRRELRLKLEKPVLDAFWSWFDSLSPVRGTRLDKAVTYVQNRRESAMTYLEDGRCSFSNNASENAIRPFTVGRRNWLFSQSTKGAEASAITYTMIEMAKAYELNIFDYLQFVLQSRPSAEMTDEDLSKLSPWSEKASAFKR